MVLQTILSAIILIVIFLIYKKINSFIDLSKENFEQNSSYLEKLSNNEKEIDKLTDINSNLQKIVDEIPKSEQSTNSKLELREFTNLMSRYSEFLNQSKFFKKIDVIESLHMIKTEGGTVDDYKLFFISEFTKLIFSNGLTFKDLDIDNDYYGYGPLEANSVWFDIENIKEINDGGDYKVFEANVIFTLKDKTKKSLKYEFYDDTIEEFDKWFKEFVFIDYERDAEPYPYFKSYKPKGKYRIVLNDLFQYLDFIGKHFYNKEFIKWNFLRYNYESLLTDDYGGYIDISWQIDKRNFTYVEEIEKKDDIEIIDSITDDELFAYALNLYYKEYSNFALKEKIFKVVKYLDKLIDNNYAMAYLVKALLYLDGKIVLKDIEKAKKLLHTAYDLGLHTPTILIWNENNLYKK